MQSIILTTVSNSSKHWLQKFSSVIVIQYCSIFGQIETSIRDFVSHELKF